MKEKVNYIERKVRMWCCPVCKKVNEIDVVSETQKVECEWCPKKWDDNSFFKRGREDINAIDKKEK